MIERLKTNILRNRRRKEPVNGIPKTHIPAKRMKEPSMSAITTAGTDFPNKISHGRSGLTRS
jgi:hypothetical protein